MENLSVSFKSKILFKWIAAFLGYLVGSFPGAVIGFVAGSFFDNYQKVIRESGGESGKSSRSFTQSDFFSYYQQQAAVADFPTALMALSAAVMKADGKIMKSELDYVKTFFQQQFGHQFQQHHLHSLKKFLDAAEVPLEQVCRDVRSRLTLEVRLQLLHYLFGIAKADSHVSPAEVQSIRRIAQLLNIDNADFESIQSMFFRNPQSDYKILGLDETATNDEIKKAYRKMAIKYHPDKVSELGEEYQKGAKDKFQEVQNAYENLKKTRDIK